MMGINLVLLLLLLFIGVGVRAATFHLFRLLLTCLLRVIALLFDTIVYALSLAGAELKPLLK